MKRMIERFKAKTTQFLTDQQGNFAIMAALAAIPLLLGVGVAVDYTSAVNVRSANQQALDAALLASARLGSKPEIFKSLKNVFEANGGVGDVSNLKVTNAAGGVSVSAIVDAESVNIISGLIGSKSMHVTVTSTVNVRPELVELKIEPDYGSGTFNKDMVLFAKERGKADYTELGRVNYRYDSVSGKKLPLTTTFDPKKPIKLKNIESAYFEMRIDPASQYAENLTYYRMRTNDPATAHYQFVDKVQLKQGQAYDLADFIPCGKKSYIDWEDGGGFAKQDFGYWVTGNCVITPSSPLVLTR